MDRLRSTPHDPIGVLRIGALEPRQAEARPAQVGAEEPQRTKPRRADITRDMVEKLGDPSGSAKCRAIAPGDLGYEAVGHSEKCRERVECIAEQDKNLEVRLEVAEERRVGFVPLCPAQAKVEAVRAAIWMRFWVCLSLGPPVPVCPARV